MVKFNKGFSLLISRHGWNVPSSIQYPISSLWLFSIRSATGRCTLERDRYHQIAPQEHESRWHHGASPGPPNTPDGAVDSRPRAHRPQWFTFWMGKRNLHLIKLKPKQRHRNVSETSIRCPTRKHRPSAPFSSPPPSLSACHCQLRDTPHMVWPAAGQLSSGASQRNDEGRSRHAECPESHGWRQQEEQHPLHASAWALFPARHSYLLISRTEVPEVLESRKRAERTVAG